MNKDYEAKIEFSSKELTVKEKIQAKDTLNAYRLDELTQGDTKVVIDVDYFCVIKVHNENSEDKEYNKIVIVAKSGDKFVTGSQSFYRQLLEIHDELAEAGALDDFTIEVIRVDSKNYKGKQFLSCSLV